MGYYTWWWKNITHEVIWYSSIFSSSFTVQCVTCGNNEQCSNMTTIYGKGDKKLYDRADQAFPECSSISSPPPLRCSVCHVQSSICIVCSGEVGKLDVESRDGVRISDISPGCEYDTNKSNTKLCSLGFGSRLSLFFFFFYRKNYAQHTLLHTYNIGIFIFDQLKKKMLNWNKNTFFYTIYLYWLPPIFYYPSKETSTKTLSFAFLPGDIVQPLLTPLCLGHWSG